jgi:hypothetical protein
VAGDRLDVLVEDLGVLDLADPAEVEVVELP